MMQHLDEGALYALLDGELSPVEQSEARAHIAVCETCRAELAEARSATEGLTGALLLLDEPRAARRYVAPPAKRTAAPFGLWNGSAFGRAAAILVLAGAAASATLPGSPVRAWLEGAGDQPQPVTLREAAPLPESASIAADVVESGVGVHPDLGVLRMTISDAAPGLRVNAMLTDSPRGGVFGIGGDGSIRFETSPGSVVVTDAGMTELRIEIPREAAEASVTINGRRYLTKEGDQLRLTLDGTAAPVQSFEVAP